jgi:hypothetical protein
MIRTLRTRDGCAAAFSDRAGSFAMPQAAVFDRCAYNRFFQ